MTILFAGGEIGAFTPSDSTVVETNTAGYFDSAFARCAITVKGSAYAETMSWTATQDLWVHFEVKRGIGSAAVAARILELLDASNVAQFKIETDTGQDNVQMYYWDGAAFQTAGSLISVDTDNSRQTIDVHFVGNSAAGSVSLYVAGTLRETASIDTSNADDITKARFYGRNGSTSEMVYSQVMVLTSESTVGKRLMTFYASGTGATDQMTGTYTNIDEITYSDADFISSTTADQVELFAGTAVGAMTGYVISAVIVTARAKTDGTGPGNLQLAARHGSTTGFSSSLALGAGMGAYVGVFTTNPSTSTTWLTSEIATTQFGIKSIT